MTIIWYSNGVMGYVFSLILCRSLVSWWVVGSYFASLAARSRPWCERNVPFPLCVYYVPVNWGRVWAVFIITSAWWCKFVIRNMVSTRHPQDNYSMKSYPVGCLVFFFLLIQLKCRFAVIKKNYISCHVTFKEASEYFRENLCTNMADRVLINIACNDVW